MRSRCLIVTSSELKYLVGSFPAEMFKKFQKKRKRKKKEGGGLLEHHVCDWSSQAEVRFTSKDHTVNKIRLTIY